MQSGVAVKVWVPPAPRFADVGVTATDSRVETETVICPAVLCTVTPLSVAFTNRPAVPEVLPAVKVTDGPVDPLIAPTRLFVRLHEYAIPEGHVLVQAGTALNGCVRPGPSAAVAGSTETETRLEADAVTVILAGRLCTVVLPRVALTKRPADPEASPAVNVTCEPEEELRVPIELRVSAHR